MAMKIRCCAFGVHCVCKDLSSLVLPGYTREDAYNFLGNSTEVIAVFIVNYKRYSN